MKTKLFPFAAIAFVMASCSSEDVIETNPDPKGDALSFSIAVGHSRAVETGIDNLGNFAVVAKGVHPHGSVYDSFLIGDSGGTDPEKVGGITAKKAGNGNWTFENTVYWPTSINDVLFWAYTCSQEIDGNISDVLPSGAYYQFEGNDAWIKDFSPEEAVLTETRSDGVWADGFFQKDLLGAFKQAKRTDGSVVDLNFKHMLSQISIEASSKAKADTDHRIVRIKGAWIVNTQDKADLKSGYKWSDKTATDNAAWTALGVKDDSKKFTAYGSFYKTPFILDDQDDEFDLLREGGSLMLIPQTIKAWDKTTTSLDADATEKANAYILLLCRVELKHKGDNHQSNPGDTDIDDIVVSNGYHYHQQFPVNASSKFNEGEYGFVCVPVGTTFEMGKKYTFNLDICGKDSGAGNYPPDGDGYDYSSLYPAGHSFASQLGAANDVTLTVVSRPAKKNVGDVVLDGAIEFNVTIEPWAAAGEDWKDGDLTFSK
jgi:lipoprotein